MSRNWLGIGIALATSASACAGASISVDDVTQGIELGGGSSNAVPGCGVSGGGHAITLKGAALVSDARLERAHNATSYGAEPYLRVRNNASSLLRFDTQTIPSSATVKGACLVLSVGDPSVRTFNAYEVARPWTEDGATWLSSARGSAWGTRGAAAASDRGRPVMASFQRSVSGPFATPFATSLVQKWVADPTTNNGIVIANPAAHDGISFSSSEVADGPALTVFYDLP